MSDPPGGLGARLRARRQAAGLSQQELAERAGLSIRAVSDLERAGPAGPTRARCSGWRMHWY
jgi:transcriptional regulator with XRE-family HTH domain